MVHTKKEFNDLLVSMNPYFQNYWPTGMRDFRGVKWPNRWRGGLFHRSGTDEWKALFGDGTTARSCRQTLLDIGIKSALIPPHTEQLNGEEYRTVVNWWALMFVHTVSDPGEPIKKSLSEGALQ